MSKREVEALKPRLTPGDRERSASKRKPPKERNISQGEESDIEVDIAVEEDLDVREEVLDNVEQNLGAELLVIRNPDVENLNQEINMALNQVDVDALIEQHTGHELRELRDLVDDYDPDSLTQVELTEFSGRLLEIRTKLQAVRLGFWHLLRALPGEDNVANRQEQEDSRQEANDLVKTHERRVKPKIAELRTAAVGVAIPLPADKKSIKVRTDKAFAESML